MTASSVSDTTCDAPRGASRQMRIDSPHPSSGEEIAAAQGAGPPEPAVGDEQAATSGASTEGPALLEVEEPSDELLAAVAGLTLESRREQLQLQVAQLAGHLRERLREVDRREAQLNARVAQLEADLRASRLWLREREREFHERETELQRQVEELQERSTLRRGNDEAAAGDTENPDDRELALAEREQQLALLESELRERRFELDREGAALRHAQQVGQQLQSREERDLARQREQLTSEYELRVAEREAELAEVERLLSEHARQLDGDREALLADRQAWEEQKARQRQAIEESRRASESEVDSRRLQLEARQEWVERQKAGLEHAREEIFVLHRQSLEMRLLAEQLWSQISGRMAPAEVTQAIAQLKRKLSEHYRLEEQSLDGKKSELVALGERIAAQHEELTQLRAGLREWATARQAEIEEQAAALVRRELALDEQQDRQRHEQHAWQAQRRHYEQQIRELKSQLHALPAAA